ncbi:MAG: lysophospholipid acyltransferase family protein [Deltaproteobacteria bacterium]|nr:lysophospholipid acyltransferase family protein [Deltaproteobacteria bacterium]
MKKKRSKINHFAQYVGFSAFASIVRLLPLNISMLLGKSIANVFYLIDRKHRKIAYENLRNAYGEELSDFQKRKIIRRCYQHLASVAIDFVKLPRKINRSNWKKHFEVEGLEFARNARKEGKGIIFVSGHIGNWEVLGCAMDFIFYPMHSIAKHMKNPFIDRSYKKLREYAGQKVIFTRNASRAMLKALKNNEMLGVLVDQNSRKNSIFVDFFGQKAATTRGVATLSLKTGAPIIMLFSRRIDGRYRFKISFSKPIQIENTGDLEKDILSLTQKYTTIIESRIREHPHEWLWMHRRWKTRPPIDSSL